MYKGTPIRLSADISAEALQVRRNKHKVMKGKNLQPRILYPARLSIRAEGEIKGFPDKQKLKQFITSKLPVQEMLRGLL